MTPAKVLVVDDETVVRRVLQQTLTSAGYEVLEAPDGTEALRIVDLAAPDLVLLDWQMPGLTGAEVLTELKRRRPELPVVLVTAALDASTAGLASVLGADVFMRKPYRPRQLLDVVARLLAGGSEGGGDEAA